MSEHVWQTDGDDAGYCEAPECYAAKHKPWRTGACPLLLGDAQVIDREHFMDRAIEAGADPAGGLRTALEGALEAYEAATAHPDATALALAGQRLAEAVRAALVRP